jgi:hypothetical protein
MHIGLNAGVQYDRSGELIMAGVPIWFGTTAEPSPNLGPNWTFEKDVTDDTALFTTAQTGFLEIANYQSKTYNSTITADATLSFFPATTAYPAPPTADKVLPLPGTGGIATLNGPTNPLSTTLTLPTNILHATLDLYLQGQSGDEFWYSCVPNSLTTQLESCGGGARRRNHGGHHPRRRRPRLPLDLHRRHRPRTLGAHPRRANAGFHRLPHRSLALRRPAEQRRLPHHRGQCLWR